MAAVLFFVGPLPDMRRTGGRKGGEYAAGAAACPSERTDRVARCIASHSVPVQTGSGLPEEVCVSNADGMSQIVKPAYWLYYVFQVRQFGFAEGRDWLRQRVEGNWAALIPPARAIIEKQYRQVGELLRL